MKFNWLHVSLIMMLILVTACTNKEKQNLNDLEVVFGKWDLDYQGAVGDTYPINLIFISNVLEGMEVDSIKFPNNPNLKVDSIELKKGDLMDDGRTLYNLTLNTLAIEAGEYSTKNIDVNFKNGISGSFEIGNLHWVISEEKSSEELVPDNGYVAMYPNMDKYTISLINNSNSTLEIEDITTENQQFKLKSILINGKGISESPTISPGQHAEINAEISADDENPQFYSISPKIKYRVGAETKETVLPSSLFGLMSITPEKVKNIIDSE